MVVVVVVVVVRGDGRKFDSSEDANQIRSDQNRSKEIKTDLIKSIRQIDPLIKWTTFFYRYYLIVKLTTYI